MDIFGSETRGLLDQALLELQQTRAALDLERSNRIAAEALAESYRVQAERANDLAHKMEDAREKATQELVDSLRLTNKQLIDAATPKEDGHTLASVKERLQQLPRQPTANPGRKAMLEADALFLQTVQQRTRARTGNPVVDKALDAAQQAQAKLN